MFRNFRSHASQRLRMIHGMQCGKPSTDYISALVHALYRACLATVALQEIQLLKRISFDRNIVQFYGACLDTQPPLLLMEFMGVSAARLLRVRWDISDVQAHSAPGPMRCCLSQLGLLIASNWHVKRKQSPASVCNACVCARNADVRLFPARVAAFLHCHRVFACIQRVSRQRCREGKGEATRSHVSCMVQGGDLFSALRSNAHGSGAAHPLSWWRHGRSIALDIARGLHFLHSEHVVPPNVQAPQPENLRSSTKDRARPDPALPACGAAPKPYGTRCLGVR